MELMSNLFRILVVAVLFQQVLRAELPALCDRTNTFQVSLPEGSITGESSLREHSIVWHPEKKKYYLLADVIPLASDDHPNTYNTEIHLFSSPDLADWRYHGVAIRKGTAADDFDRYGVASPVAATLVDGVIYCPYSARKTRQYTGRSAGLAWSGADPEQIPWNKSGQPVSDLPGEDDDVALISTAGDDRFHLYHRTTGADGYQIVYRASKNPRDKASWSKAIPVAAPPEMVRAQELTGAVFVDGLFHLFIIEHFHKGSAQIAHVVSQQSAGPFRAFQKNQRYLEPEDQPRNIIYSGHITPVVRQGKWDAFFWTTSQQGKRYGLTGHPVRHNP